MGCRSALNMNAIYSQSVYITMEIAPSRQTFNVKLPLRGGYFHSNIYSGPLFCCEM